MRKLTPKLTDAGEVLAGHASWSTVMTEQSHKTNQFFAKQKTTANTTLYCQIVQIFLKRRS